MWNLKSVLLFVASLFVVIVISMSMANAEEKTITPKEFATNVSEVPSKVGNHLKNEWIDIKEYQANSFAEMKKTWPWNKIFKGKND